MSTEELSPIATGEEEAHRSADAEHQIEKLKLRRSEVRRRITITCSEIAKILKRVGSRTSLNRLVEQAEDLLRKSEKLNNQLCAFKDKVDTAKEFQSQLEYQRSVQDAKEDVENYSQELFWTPCRLSLSVLVSVKLSSDGFPQLKWNIHSQLATSSDDVSVWLDSNSRLHRIRYGNRVEIPAHRWVLSARSTGRNNKQPRNHTNAINSREWPAK